MSRMRQIVIFGFIACLAGGCGRGPATRVEAWHTGEWQDVPVAHMRISGGRDGERTRASAVFTLQDGRELRVELGLVYNPAPELESGTWQVGAQNGVVVAEAVKFFGGQGAGPSVGGRYRLEEDARPRYRVTFPAQPVSDRVR